MDETLYEVLQVDRRADPEVIDVAYRRLARKYHPDAAGQDASQDHMRRLNAAYEILSDRDARRQYDEERLKDRTEFQARKNEADAERRARDAMVDIIRSMQTRANRVSSPPLGGLAGLDGTAVIKAQDGTYLGVISSSRHEADSICNPYGDHGSTYSRKSIRNQYCPYGGQYGQQSPFNPYASSPPTIIQGGRAIAHLTVNPRFKNAVSPHELLAHFPAA